MPFLVSAPAEFCVTGCCTVGEVAEASTTCQSDGMAYVNPKSLACTSGEGAWARSGAARRVRSKGKERTFIMGASLAQRAFNIP
jgi:hypothetical protein